MPYLVNSVVINVNQSLNPIPPRSPTNPLWLCFNLFTPSSPSLSPSSRSKLCFRFCDKVFEQGCLCIAWIWVRKLSLRGNPLCERSQVGSGQKKQISFLMKTNYMPLEFETRTKCTPTSIGLTFVRTGISLPMRAKEEVSRVVLGS